MPPQPNYEIPEYGSNPSHTHGWLLEALAESEAWLKAQRPTVDWEKAMQLLAADGDVALEGLSGLQYPKAKRIARELVASLANFRHEGEVKVTWNNELYDTAHMLTNLDQHWNEQTFANEAYRGALQYAVAKGTGYLFEGWDKHFHSSHRGDIRMSAIDPADVGFVQLPKSHDIQRAYAVIIREELPINLAKAIYAETNPAFAEALVPDRDAPGWLQRGLQKVQQFVSPALRVAGRSPANTAQSSFPTVDIFHMYVMDRTINDGGASREMGVPGTNWSYTVPSIGDPMPTSIVNPATGQFFTEPATPEHCKLFPLRRYVIFSRISTCYDGSSPYWHGACPLARIRFTDWAWEALGQSQIGDLKSLQDGAVALMRGMEDAAAARLDPPGAFDDRLGDTFRQAVNLRKAGVRTAVPFDMIPDPYKPYLPAEYYNVPNYVPDMIASYEAKMDYLSGVTDLVAIAKAKQVPGADTLEKLMEMAGPIVQDSVRRVEVPLQQLGNWRIANFFQFYTRPRMLTVNGPEGVPIDVLYKPETLAKIQAGETPEQYASRKRGMLDDFYYHVTESGINEIYRLSNKLLYLQLSKAGFPIDWWTLAKVMQIPSFGPPPEGTNTVMERWIAQKRIETDLALDQQQQIAAEMGPQQVEPGVEGGQPQGPKPAGSNPEGGRPPSFQAAPRLVQKDGGARSTVTTS
jgi:hypothetical protein